MSHRGWTKSRACGLLGGFVVGSIVVAILAALLVSPMLKDSGKDWPEYTLAGGDCVSHETLDMYVVPRENWLIAFCVLVPLLLLAIIVLLVLLWLYKNKDWEGIHNVVASPKVQPMIFAGGPIYSTVSLPGFMYVAGTKMKFACKNLTLNLRSNNTVDGSYETHKGRVYYVKSGSWDSAGNVRLLLKWTDGEYNLTGKLSDARHLFTGTWAHTESAKSKKSGHFGTFEFKGAVVTTPRSGLSALQQVAMQTPTKNAVGLDPYSPTRFGVTKSPGGVSRVVRLRGTMSSENAGATYHCRLLTLHLRANNSVDGTYESDHGTSYAVQGGYWDTTGKVSFVLTWTQGNDYQITGTMNGDCTQYVGSWLNCDPNKAHMSGHRGRHHFSTAL